MKRFLIEVWEKWGYNDNYRYREYWSGDSFFLMIWYLYKARKDFACVRLDWRDKL